MICKEIQEVLNCNKCANAAIKYGRVDCQSSIDDHRKLFKKHGTSAAGQCEGFLKVVVGDYSKITLDRALKYVLSGSSEFKLVSGKTSREIFYRVTRKSAACTGSNNDNQFIYWLYSGESYDSLKYLGSIYFNKNQNCFEFARGKLGVGNKYSVEVKAILYFMNRIYSGKFNTNIEIYHNGNCGKCGKKLRNVMSINTGLDPDCAKKVIIPDIDMKNVKYRDDTFKID